MSDPATGGFVMLGKTFKGMTDELLAWQTTPLLQLEVAFDGVQAPGGVALRFARMKGYRPDKRPDQADTIDTVRALR